MKFSIIFQIYIIFQQFRSFITQQSIPDCPVGQTHGFYSGEDLNWQDWMKSLERRCIPCNDVDITNVNIKRGVNNCNKCRLVADYYNSRYTYFLRYCIECHPDYYWVDGKCFTLPEFYTNYMLHSTTWLQTTYNPNPYIRCVRNCIKCATLTSCSICFPGHTLKNGECQQDGCHANCLTCRVNNNSNQCVLCPKGKSLYGVLDTSSNPSTYRSFACNTTSSHQYGTVINSATNCPANCLGCVSSSSTTCMNCQFGFQPTINQTNQYRYNSTSQNSFTCTQMQRIQYDNTGNDCHANCQTCIKYNIAEEDDQMCLTCKENYGIEIWNSWNYKFSPGPKRCWACGGNAKRCYIFQDNWRPQYSLECIDGYAVTNLGVCVPCDSNSKCKTCVYNQTAYCLSCISTSSEKYMSPTNTCVATCPSQYYKNDATWSCISCPSPSITCTSATQFLSCITTHYHRSANNTCVPCISPCQTCTTETNCLTCISTAYFRSNACYSTCPAETYPNATASSVPICADCQSPCVQCSTLLNCITCIPSYFLYQNRCYPSCSGIAGTYPKSDIAIPVCQPCVYPCLNCLTATECTSCSQVSGIRYFKNNQCYSTCPALTYPNATASSVPICDDCQSPCVQCSTLLNCITCIPSYFLYQNRCYPSCSGIAGTYPKSDIPIPVCQPCVYPCLNCLTATSCTSCNQYLGDKFLTGTSCGFCASGYYGRSSDFTCQLCTSPCAQCSSMPTKCTSCITNYQFDMIEQECFQGNCGDRGLYLQQTFCLRVCTSGYYPDQATWQCIQCTNNCQTCTSATSCLSCNLNYFLSGTACVTSCPTPLYKSLIRRVCVHAPQDGEFIDSTGTLQSCDESCYTCSGSATACTACAFSFKEFNPSNLSTFQCVFLCPWGYMTFQANKCVLEVHKDPLL